MNPFDELGITPAFNLDMRALEQIYLDHQAIFHPDKHVHSLPHERTLAQQRSIRVNQAYGILKNPLSRARALLQHKGIQVPGENGSTIANPDLLMEMMMWQERLADCKTEQERVAFANELQQDFDTACNAFGTQQDVPQYLRLTYIGKLLTQAKVLKDADSTE